jgi:hypothetical protein
MHRLLIPFVIFSSTCVVGTASAAQIAAQTTLRLTQEFRIGDADDAELGFSRIGNIAVDAKSNVYVVEQQDQQIRVFDAKGKPVRRIGHKGKGPGEFTQIDRIGFRGDTLWVRDPQLARITMFDTQGKLLKTFPAPGYVRLGSPIRGTELSSSAGGIASDGYIHMDKPGGVVFLGTEKPADSVRAPILRFDRAGEVVDTIMQIPLYLLEDHDKGTARSGRSGSYRPAQTDMMIDPGPPSDAPLRVILDRDVILIDRHRATSRTGATYTITRTAPNGRVLYRRQIRYKPIPYTGAFAKKIEADRGIKMPALQPPVSKAIAGLDGTLWLRRDADGDPTTTWTVISANGVALGDIALPAKTEIRYIGPDFVYLVERDEDDIPYLVRYRMTTSNTRG